MSGNKGCLTVCGIVLSVSLLGEDLTCLYNFDSDNIDESLYVITLYGFFFLTALCQSIVACNDKCSLPYTVVMILIELSQAILMMLFVGAFKSNKFQVAAILIFLGVFLLQAVLECIFFCLSKSSNDSNNRSHAIQSVLLRLGAAIVVGIYTIPGLFLAQSFQNVLYSIWMDTIFTIGITCFDLVLFLFESKIIGAPTTTLHYCISALLTAPIIVYAFIVAIIGVVRIFAGQTSWEEAIYFVCLIFLGPLYIGLVVFVSNKKLANEKQARRNEGNMSIEISTGQRH